MTGQRYATFAEYLKHEYRGPHVATDIIINYNGGIVLIERKEEPYGISLPGGMAEHMTLSENAVKEAKEETGLDVIIKQPNQPFYVSSNVNRDPRAFIISVTYTARGYGTLEPHPDEDAKRAFVVPFHDLEQVIATESFAFEAHREVLREYLRTQQSAQVRT